jgi:uncharacterized hydrophobic protein (TIGR00341 family)
MRLLQVLVDDDQLEPVTELLDAEGVDYLRQRVWTGGDGQWLVEFPLPSDAIGYMRTELEDLGIDTQRYITITGLESASTPSTETLQDRFADDFDPLTSPELRSKARDMSPDTRSFLAMILFSSIIAVAGLLINSPEVVVGSMVIAPIVGPVMTATVGAVTGDREMLLHSVWIQAAGLAVALVGAAAFAWLLQAAGFYPRTLSVTSIDLIAARATPNLIIVAIGLAAGAAGAFGLVTKGPTSLIGVMIAAALIPAAATAGIAAVWGDYRLAVGALLLLLLSIVAINIGAYVVLQRFYRSGPGRLLPEKPGLNRIAIAATVIAVVLLVAVVGGTTYQQVTFERTVNTEVEDTLDEPRYQDLGLVSVQMEYGEGSYGSPQTVTAVVSRSTDGTDPPPLADELDRRITAATDEPVDVRVQFVEYQRG